MKEQEEVIFTFKSKVKIINNSIFFFTFKNSIITNQKRDMHILDFFSQLSDDLIEQAIQEDIFTDNLSKHNFRFFISSFFQEEAISSYLKKNVSYIKKDLPYSIEKSSGSFGHFLKGLHKIDSLFSEKYICEISEIDQIDPTLRNYIFLNMHDVRCHLQKIMFVQRELLGRDFSEIEMECHFERMEEYLCKIKNFARNNALKFLCDGMSNSLHEIFSDLVFSEEEKEGLEHLFFFFNFFKEEEQDIDSESMLEDSDPSESMLEDSDPSESMLEDSDPSESMLEDSEPSESMLEDSEPSESMLEDSEPSESMLEDSEPSESSDETKPVEDPDRWNSERFKHLWYMCDNCDTFIYKTFFLEQKGVCLECGATLQLTSSERIQLLIDDGTWRSMNMTLASMDVLDKKHTTYDIKMVQKYSIILYEGICDYFFHNPFFFEKNILKILVRYNITLVDIVNVVLEKKFIQYLNLDLDSKKNLKIIQDIIDTGLKTVQFELFEIGKKIKNEFYWVRLLHPDLYHLDLDIADRDRDVSRDTSLDDINHSILTYLSDNSIDIKQRILLQHKHFNKHLINFKLLLKLNNKLANLKEKLLSQDKFLKVAVIFLMKIELYFPGEKRKMRKIKKIFPFYPGNDPETNYFLWLRKHMSICLMETYLVFQKLKYWFKNRCSDLPEQIYRFGSDILVEYVKKQDRYDFDDIINYDPLCFYSNNETYIEDTEDIEEKAEVPAWDRLRTFFLLQLMKDFSETSIRILDNKEKFILCKKKKETYIEDTEDTEDTEDIEEEYPLTYASLTKEEKEYIDASVELIRSTLNLGQDEFIDTEEEQCYDDYNISYQKETGLYDAIQTGIGKINGFTVALGVMDFQFMGGSMGSVVGEKISRLIQYATEHFLPLILVCASGGARMQEGSYSLMQMNKIAALLHTHQKERHLLYISVLTSPTTGGVTASFGMLGDVIIVEPNAYIAFAGKRVIEQTLNQIVDDEDQISDSLFDFGMFDSMVPRALLKKVLSEIIDLYMYCNYI